MKDYDVEDVLAGGGDPRSVAVFDVVKRQHMLHGEFGMNAVEVSGILTDDAAVVQATLEWLESKGFLYSTIDPYHFMPTGH